MTSNLGAEHLVNQSEGADVEEVRGQVMDVVQKAFRPEFLNRLDDILLFRRLGREQMTGIVDIQLGYLHKLLADRHIDLTLDDKAKAWIADKGYNPAYGARPLKRVIQNELQNRLAELLLEGKVSDGDKVKVTEKKDALDFAIDAAGKSSKKDKDASAA